MEKTFSNLCQTIFALATVALTFLWLHPLVAATTWLALTSLLAVAATIYGVGHPGLAAGDLRTDLSGRQRVGISLSDPGEPAEWFFPLTPIAALGTLSFATVGWFVRKSDAKSEVRDPLLQVALIYRWLALVMSLYWLWEYIPDRQHVGAFMLTAIGVFALAVWRRNREALIATSVYAVAALFALWATNNSPMDVYGVNLLWANNVLQMDVYWMNFVSLLAPLAMQQILRRFSQGFALDENIYGAIIFITGVSLWRFVSCWTATFTGGFFLTMAWAGFAVLVFAAGIILRERFYRWLGLGVLAASVGRVVLVDVWKQETIYRVLTFMALGVALLVIGFVYNKFQETIRKWL